MVPGSALSVELALLTSVVLMLTSIAVWYRHDVAPRADPSRP